MKTLVRCASLASVVAVVLLLYGGGHASDPFAVAVANAATTCPEGFTVEVHGLPAGSAPTSSLSERCVLDLGIPAGATGAPGPTGTPGTYGVSGYELVTTINSTKSNTFRLAAVAKCPAGKKAIGGGASVTTVKGTKSNSDNRWAITTSQPTPDGQGWMAITMAIVSSANATTAGHRLKVTAICAVAS